MDELKTVRDDTHLEEGIPVLERYLLETYLNPGIATKELARRCLLPVPVAVAVKKEMCKLDLVNETSGVRPGRAGIRYIEETMGYQGIDLALFKRIREGSVSAEEILPELNGLPEIFNDRPSVDVTIDQSKGTAATAVKRALLCLKYGQAIGKRVLCLGDDDLVSVALCFVMKRLFKSGPLPCSVFVLDLDERFVAYIGSAADGHHFPIKAMAADLRRGIPADMGKSMDTVFTDPPYTLPGATLFLSRAGEALREGEGRTVFFSYAHRSPSVTRDLYGSFLALGFIPVEIIPRFNEYEGAGMFGSTSQLMVLLTSQKPGTRAYEPSGDGLIYTGEINRTMRLYSCQACKRRIRVGREQTFITIENLKQAGCPDCGAKSFDLIERKKTGQEE